MYITLEADYAIRIVYFLAQSGEKVDAKTISEKTSVSFRFSLKILRKLVSAELVKSFKGTKGGYKLALEPDKITLKDIVTLIDGDIVMSRCLSGEYPCTKEHTEPCKVQCAFKKISDVIKSELDKVKISDLL